MSLIGIDEVGRGCWAGPLLVVAARAKAQLPVGLTDSKQLSKKAREQFLTELVRLCDYGEGWVAPSEIDELGLTTAMRLGVARALAALGAHMHDEIVMDGNYNYCAADFTNVRCIIKADATVPEVSAASIIAKVQRDAYMTEQAAEYPEYGFGAHVGYGTAAHAKALADYGVTALHRKSFKPVQKCMNI